MSSFKPVHGDPNTAAIRTNDESNIVRAWLKANWAVSGLNVSKVDFEFIHEDRGWEGKDYVLNFYSEPISMVDFEVSPNSKEYKTRVMVDIWVNDSVAYAQGIISPYLISIEKWIIDFVNLNPLGLNPDGISVVECENQGRYHQFGPSDDANWYHFTIPLIVWYVTVKS